MAENTRLELTTRRTVSEVVHAGSVIWLKTMSTRASVAAAYHDDETGGAYSRAWMLNDAAAHDVQSVVRRWPLCPCR